MRLRESAGLPRLGHCGGDGERLAESGGPWERARGGRQRGPGTAKSHKSATRRRCRAGGAGKGAGELKSRARIRRLERAEGAPGERGSALRPRRARGRLQLAGRGGPGSPAAADSHPLLVTPPAPQPGAISQALLPQPVAGPARAGPPPPQPPRSIHPAVPQAATGASRRPGPAAAVRPAAAADEARSFASGRCRLTPLRGRSLHPTLPLCAYPRPP